MNVQGAWAEGITGNGVVVTILDDGLEKDHPDLFKNYVSLYVCLLYINMFLLKLIGFSIWIKFITRIK